MPACASLRSDLAPGAAYSDFSWDGVFFQLTSRNCYDATTFEPGTPMLAHICYGIRAGQYDVSAFTCTDYPFAYGTPLVEIELR